MTEMIRSEPVHTTLVALAPADIGPTQAALATWCVEKKASLEWTRRRTRIRWIVAGVLTLIGIWATLAPAR